ncbi:MAG TPA: hypothetical protein VL175_04175 [Pirellulales bacterium]|jgi:hypothetical protein|nr:hypothetical protein [Pirellulales bacterium]
MSPLLLLIAALTAAEAGLNVNSPSPPSRVTDLIKQADTSFLIKRLDRGIEQYGRLVELNPTVGLYWYRLGICYLESGEFGKAIPALEKAEELGSFQWNPPRMVYHGEAALALAAAHAQLGQKDEALRWTRTSLAQGLRNIRRFHGKQFESLLKDDDYRKLVWATDVSGLSRDEGFRHDLRFLMHEAKRVHYAPYKVVSEARLDEMASALDRDIPTLSDEQVLVRMMGIVRHLGDGHTHIRAVGQVQRVPLVFFEFPEGIYVIAALEPHGDLVGAKVLKIGDRSIDECMKLAREITSRDNPMNVLSTAPWLLSSLRVLKGLGILKDESVVPLEIEDASGQSRRVEVPTEAVAPNPKDNKWINTVAGQDAPMPLHLRHRDKTYWFERLPEERLVYCQMNGIGTNNQKTMMDFCRDLFAEVAKDDIDGLVLDMRHNGGGDTFTNPPLIEGIIRSEKLQTQGRLFVITGRETFSAAQNTVSELERRTKAILVGEPTGSRPNFIGESIQIVLPKSGWITSISDLWWQHSMAMDYRIWTPPQLYAPPTAASFREHRDPALEAILAYRKK